MAERISSAFLNKHASELDTLSDLAHSDVSQKLSEALESLVTRRIHALPVFEKDKYIGLVTLKNIVAFVVQQFYKRAGATSPDKIQRIEVLKSHQFTDEDYRVISEDIHKEPLKNHIESAPAVAENTTFKELIKALSTSERIPVINSSGKIVNVVSQSGLLKYISKHASSVGSVINETIEHLNCITKPVRTVHVNTPAIVAFAIMVESGFSSLGFLDDDSQHISGVISFKDIRGAVTEGTHTLLKGVEDYVNNIRRNDERNIAKDVVPTVNCSAKDSLGKVIAKLTAVGIHRLFVREEGASDFMGIVSLSDVLKVFQ